MTVETHWICDVCGKRIMGESTHKDVNQTGIKEWFVVNLTIHHVNDISGKRVSEWGYACSDKCVKTLIGSMRELSINKMIE